MAFSNGDGGPGSALSEINVTPLVDVMLVLLIIFMIAAPMLTTGVNVDLPKADAPRMDIDQEHPLISVQSGFATSTRCSYRRTSKFLTASSRKCSRWFGKRASGRWDSSPTR